ncbi:uncharacterized protein EDB91DRAFT_1254529 [Suillus paluster]|uniref:uncharacterized protein n=1 Tax=Suillus paluster TaxID=48578 RepID=UPI001B862F1F|nr:uncharacterized protein EDB91DRAFT_1254529 [Suillus paluster]KAG1726016.1 hypothetical protein EDB91DRAFT_1254529 [Suillus paluster]
MAAVFRDFVGGTYYYTHNSRGKTPGSDMKNEPTTSGMPVLSMTSSWISNRSRQCGPKTETLHFADVTCKSSNTPAVVPETKTVATAKPQADTAVVQHDQVLGITHVITARPDGCHEQLIDALQQVWVEPVCFINVSADDHVHILEHMDALTFSNYHTKMSYFSHRMILIIYSPHPVHEQTIMKPTTAIAAETQLLWMVESRFTQSWVAIMTKMGDILLLHKELLLILMILVKERKKYVSPAANSVTWNQTREEGSVQTYSDFTPECTAKKLFGPVVAMGHEWIDIESVEYFVWVKSGDQCIDLTAAPMAHGTSLMLQS